MLGLSWFFNINLAGCLLACFVYAFRAIVAVICGIPCFIIAVVELIKISNAAKSIEIETVTKVENGENHVE